MVSNFAIEQDPIDIAFDWCASVTTAKDLINVAFERYACVTVPLRISELQYLLSWYTPYNNIEQNLINIALEWCTSDTNSLRTANWQHLHSCARNVTKLKKGQS